MVNIEYDILKDSKVTISEIHDFVEECLGVFLFEDCETIPKVIEVKYTPLDTNVFSITPILDDETEGSIKNTQHIYRAYRNVIDPNDVELINVTLNSETNPVFEFYVHDKIDDFYEYNGVNPKDFIQ